MTCVTVQVYRSKDILLHLINFYMECIALVWGLVTGSGAHKSGALFVWGLE